MQNCNVHNCHFFASKHRLTVSVHGMDSSDYGSSESLISYA